MNPSILLQIFLVICKFTKMIENKMMFPLGYFLLPLPFSAGRSAGRRAVRSTTCWRAHSIRHGQLLANASSVDCNANYFCARLGCINLDGGVTMGYKTLLSFGTSLQIVGGGDFAANGRVSPAAAPGL